MSSETISQLIKQRASLMEELGTLSHILHGSWVERYSVCSRPECKCHRGERHGPRYYVVVNVDGRQRQKYIPNAQTTAAQSGIAQYRRLQEIVQEITKINLKLIKEKAYVDS